MILPLAFDAHFDSDAAHFSKLATSLFFTSSHRSG
jgi:hypothetical protein